MGIRKDDVVSKKRIDETHQAARVIVCRIAANMKPRIGYSEIGRKINRARENVWHNVNNAISGSSFESEHYEKKIMEKLKGK